MNIGYMRVSTQDKQEFDRQEFALKDCHIDRMYFEKISGGKKAFTREQFEIMVSELNEGDTVYFESISRMARNVEDLIHTTEYLVNEKSVRVVFLKEQITMGGGTGTDAMTKLMFNIFASFAEFEKGIISDRTKQALAAKKAQGVKLGRETQYGADVVAQIEDMTANGMSVRAIANELGMSASTVSRIKNGQRVNG